MDGGAYTTLTPVVLSRGTIHAGGPYDVANVRIRSRAVATNTPPNGAFRGFGAPQVEFAAEMQVSRAAEAIGLSPLEVRAAQRLPARRRDADEPAAARRRRGERGPRSGRRGERVRAGAGEDGRRAGGARARRAHGPRHRPRAGLARRGLHRARARRRWARSRASSAPATAGSGSSRRRRRWGRGRRRSFRSWSRPSSGSTSTTSRWRPRTRRSCPTPGRRSPRAPRWSWAGC